MDKQMLESRLRLYKRNKAEVKTTLQRIEVWEEALKKGDLKEFIYTTSRIIGMPKSSTVNSSVESDAICREVTAEMVSEWIEDDKSRIHYKKLELDQIDEALNALTREQRTVIETKYFDGRMWRNIEIIFNDRHSVGRVYITTEMLRKINREALEVLWEILGSLYQKYLYFKQCI